MSDTTDIIRLLASIDRRLAQVADAMVKTPLPTIDPNQAYSRQEAARLLRVSLWSIDRARKNGLLVDTRRLGERDIRITGESLFRFHREREDRGHVRVNRM